MIYNFINESINILFEYYTSQINDKNSLLSDVYPLKNTKTFKKNMVYPIGYDIHKNLGELYEKSIPKPKQKDLGKFYTNNINLVKMIIDKLEIPNGKILEPSCGSGIFVTEIIKKIFEKKIKNGENEEEILKYIVENIYVNDIDTIALDITEVNILSILMPYIIKAKNKNHSFKLPKLKLLNYDFVKEKQYEKKFDLIIGNPPFVTMYGKRSRNMTEEKRAFFNKFDFVENKNGNNKFNLSMFFIENGLKRLNDSGELIYILDITFFETAFKDIRKYLLENYTIKYITLGLKAFENVTSGQIIISLINKKNQNNKVNVVDIFNNKFYIVNQEKWNDKKNEYKFELPLNNIENSIVEKIEKFNCLDYYYKDKSLRTCCALTGRTDDFIVNDTKKYKDTNIEIFPYIEGAKGLEYKFAKPTIKKYIKYDYDLQIKISDEFKDELSKKGVKNKKRVTLGDKEAYKSPKIFIRQSAKELISTYCEDNYAANNSIYILTNKKNDEKNKKDLKYTCGLINSKLLTFYALTKKIIRADVGKTPQIKISDLKKIRIAFNDEYYIKIISLVEEMLDKYTEKKQNKLDELVYHLYDLDNNQIEYIKKYFEQY